ncbi:ATP-grasp domain-containing protein [Streptomyces sp. NPDC056061]|uniref:ATP-grasp domain-containing protein n=1 Tax=Streptomyces sp. NPDC056061 TaxID=3345700 RepID=UPI0035E1467C
MTTLVLHRGSLRANPYEKWLDGLDTDLVLLASAEQLKLNEEELPTHAPYVHAEALDDYDHGAHVARRAAELVERYGVSDIVACQENDIERAALLRRRFGLPGQQPESAVPYRDKWVMKRTATAAGIAVAPHALLGSTDDLDAFVAEHGLPVVVKPRRGAGSIGLRILRTEQEYAHWCEGAEPTDDAGEPAWLAEAYVEGRMCHVDGTVLDGGITTLWPSMYQYVLADYTDRKGRVDIALDASDPLAHRLKAFAERLLDAFGGGTDFAFHIEVFVTPDGDLVLCEAACRAGGAGVRDVQRAMFGFDPAEYPVRRQLGLPVGPTHRREPDRLASQLLFTRRPGRLRALPDPKTLPDGVVKYHCFAGIGDEIGEACHSGDFLAAFVIAGADRAQCETRVRAAEAWFLKGLRID